MARGTIPKIVWGANTLYVGRPLDMAVSWPEPRPGSEKSRAPSGVEDGWILGDDYFLKGEVRHIPTTDGTTVFGDSITGWDGATGWSAFLQYARGGNSFTFYPDKGSATSFTCYLVEPMDGPPDLETSDMTRRFTLVIVTSDGEIGGY